MYGNKIIHNHTACRFHSRNITDKRGLQRRTKRIGFCNSKRSHRALHLLMVSIRRNCGYGIRTGTGSLYRNHYGRKLLPDYKKLHYHAAYCYQHRYRSANKRILQRRL